VEWHPTRNYNVSSPGLSRPLTAKPGLMLTFSFSEIFGTVIVSCTPTLSGYWFNILAKSSFWTSLQSSFSKLSQSRKSKSTSSIRYQCNPASSSRIQRYEEIEDKKFAADVGQKGGVFLSTTESVAMVPMTPRSG